MNSVSKDINQNLDRMLEAEARGDESNLKGTDYHIVYALWLLLVQRMEPIYFFAGNDLLASPLPPPRDLNDDLSLNLHTGQIDEWIQLKCVVKPWTTSALLDGNLVANFIFNSIVSEKNGRDWVARLVTTAPIRRDDVAAFIKSPDDYPTIQAKLSKLINKAFTLLQKSGTGQFTPQRLRERAIDVLRQLSECEPVPFATLRAELDVELALYSRGDAEAMSALRKRLVGAILQDVANGSVQSYRYDIQWLEKSSKLSLARRGTFSVTQVCLRQVRSRAPDRFNKDHIATRKVSSILDQFAQSNATLFILAGRSGTGKTCSLYQWSLGNPCTLFIPGYRLIADDLCSVVANEVRVDLPSGTDHELFADLVRASQALGSRMTILIDDVAPTYNMARGFAERFAETVLFAQTHGVKIVASSQLDVIRSLRPFELVSKHAVFQVNLHSPPSNDPSWIQDDLTTDELRTAIALRNKRGEMIAAKLSDPAFSVVRNPYILDAVLGQIGQDDETVHIGHLTEVIELQVQKRLDQARRRCNLSIAQLRSALSSLAFFLNKTSDSQMLDVSNHLLNSHSAFGTEALNAFVESGILAEWERVVITDQRIAARLISDQVLATSPSTAQLLSLIAHSQSNPLAIDILVSLPDPIAFAEALIQRSNDWISAVAEGLSLSRSDEAQIESFLVALSRSAPPHEEIYRAIGRLALRSDFARHELHSRFIESQTADSEAALQSIASVVDINPSVVITFAQDKWDLTAGAPPTFPSRSREYHAKRKNLADAIAPLTRVNSYLAVQPIQEFLSAIEAIVAEPLRVDDDDERVSHCFTDPLIITFAEVRTNVEALLDEGHLNRFAERFSAGDRIVRIPAILGFSDWAIRNPEKATTSMVALLNDESDCGVFATLVWDAVNVARQSPRLVINAISTNAETAWRSYESTCATVALLESIAEHFPAEVLECLPPDIAHLPDEHYWLAQELVHFCHLRCAKELSTGLEPLMVRWGPVSASNALYRYRAFLAEALCKIAGETHVASFPHYWRKKYRHARMDVFSVGIAAWYRDEFEQPLEHSVEQELVDIVVELSNSASDNHANVLDEWRTNVRFWIEVDSLDVMVRIAEARQDQLLQIKRLPADWQQLYVVNGLLQLGQHGNEIVTFALSLCEQKGKSATMQAIHERNRCLTLLERIVPNRLPPIAEEQGFLFIGGSGQARLVGSLENAPRMAVEILATALKAPEDILLLTRWKVKSRHWATILMSRVYCGMFRKKAITLHEAKHWCRWMIEVCDELSISHHVKNQRSVYTAILKRLNDDEQLGLPVLVPTVGPIFDSDHLALRILGLPKASLDTIRALFIQRLGWWESHNHHWEENGSFSDSFGFGENHYVIGFYPAVRLALIAVSRQVGSPDPGYDFIVERSFGELIVKRLCNRLKWDGVEEEINTALEKYPEHEQLWALLGHCLLIRGQPEQAKKALRTALSLPLCREAKRASVLYNLACAYAICGESNETQQSLRALSRLQPIDLEWISNDADFDRVRDQAWFRRLVRSETLRQEWRSKKRRVIAWLSKYWKRLDRST